MFDFFHRPPTIPNMITVEETITVDETGKAFINLPASIKPGMHRATVHIDEEVSQAAQPDHSKLIGLCRGKIGFLPGWNEPVDDFREYLE
jgi:hypothetical protein